MKIFLLASDHSLKPLIEEYLIDSSWTLELLPELPLNDSLEGVFFVECSPQSQLNWSDLSAVFQKYAPKNWVICSLLPPNFIQSHLLVKYEIPFLMHPFDKENFFQKVKQCQSIK